MQLTQLEYLIAVEKYGSISKAARELYTSQSSISTSIRTLEMELGVELLRRGPKGVHVTEAGQEILENAKIVSRCVEDMKTVRERVNGTIRGNVTAGGDGYCCMNILGATAVDVRERYPEIQVSLKRSSQKLILSEVSDGSMDLGLFQVNQFNDKYVRTKLEYSQLECREILKSHLVAGVNSGHPLYGREQVTLEDLMPYEITTGFARAEDLIYWSLFCEMRRRGYTKPITCLGDVAVSRFYAVQRNCIQLMPRVALDMTNPVFAVPLYPVEIDQRYELKYLMVFREDSIGQVQKLFMDAADRYLEPYQDGENRGERGAEKGAL